MKKNGRNMKVWSDDTGEEGEVMDELGEKRENQRRRDWPEAQTQAS